MKRLQFSTIETYIRYNENDNVFCMNDIVDFLNNYTFDSDWIRRWYL